MEHEYPALSLESTKSIDDMVEWLDERPAVLSWKYDGCTVILTYDNGRLVRAETRGDGQIGEDITHHALHFHGVPKRIRDKRHIIVRGEAVIFHKMFSTINNTLPATARYKNPRSMVAGALRFLDSSKSAKFNIEFMPFDLVNAQELGFETVHEAFSFIFFVLEMTNMNSTLVESGDQLRGLLESSKTVAKLTTFASDGKVVVLDDLSLHSTLGANRKYPKYAKAFKWPDTMKTSVLTHIDWSVAKSGLISPVACFEPIELEGTIVKRANLHNISIMQELGLGIGDRISVYKSNMIIPRIYEDLDKTGNITIPDICPVCGAPIERRLGVNKKSEFLYCTNTACTAKGVNDETETDITGAD